MKNVVIEVLDREHGAKVVKYFRNLGFKTDEYTGSETRLNGDNYRYYGVDGNGKFDNFKLEQVNNYGFSIVTLPTEVNEETQSINNNQINMNLVKTKEVTLNNTKREITIAIVVENGVVKSGYSIRLPEDKANAELAEKIATGRAFKEKTNLTPDTELGKGLDKKYILHAIADNLFLKIERGVLKIKGVK